MIQHEVKIHNQSFNLRVQQTGQLIWFHFKGRIFVISAKNNMLSSSQVSQKSFNSLTNSFSQKNNIETNKTKIVSPMPGKIIKIFVKTGDQVKENQSLLTLCAMKMEYNIKTPYNGLVSKINIKEGDIVSLDQELISIK